MNTNKMLKRLLLFVTALSVLIAVLGIARWLITGVFDYWGIFPFIAIAITNFSVYRFAKFE